MNLPCYTSRVIWEATEVNLYDKFNREGGYQLNPLPGRFFEK
jgi:hypothetical protein